MVSWERYTDENEKSLATTELDTLSTHVLHYLFIDGNGNVIGKEHTAPAAISGCHPIVKGNKVVYYASNAGAVSFYCIDSDPSKAIFSKKTTLVAGKDATWSFKNGVLTVAGTGALDGSLSSDGLSVIKDKITKIIIKKGITAIPDETFSYLRAVKEVRIPTGVTSIGSHAFYGLEAPDATVCIPASVKTIAEDAFDSGWYTWGYENKIIYATIYCPKGSYAQTYAKQQGITCYEPSVTVKKTTVSYTGKKAATPKTTCKGTIGKLSYIYYCDKACTKKTSKTQGAASSGAMPVKAGTYYVRATAAADDTFGKVRSKAAQYIIIKAKQTIKLAKSKFTASRGAVSKLKLKATASAKKKITFAKKSGNSRITVSSAGVVKVPKGMKKGTYAIKVKITAAGNANYKKTAVTKKVTIVVK